MQQVKEFEWGREVTYDIRLDCSETATMWKPENAQGEPDPTHPQYPDAGRCFKDKMPCFDKDWPFCKKERNVQTGQMGQTEETQETTQTEEITSILRKYLMWLYAMSNGGS